MKTKRVNIRSASLDDIPALATMNLRLIEDEKSRNPMSLAQLEERMRGWLKGEWQAAIISDAENIIGYALYRERRDEYVPEKWNIYLRQFYIERQYRRKGLGTIAFEQIAQQFLSPDIRIILEVLESNVVGRRFWENLGFTPYCTTMHRQTTDSPPSQM